MMRLIMPAAIAAALVAASCRPASVTNTTTGRAASQKERHVRFLQIADTHAQLEAHPELIAGGSVADSFPMMGGYARSATVFSQDAVLMGAPR